MSKLAADGATLALPVVADRDLPLAFRKWVPGDALLQGAYGILEPAEDAEPVAPDVLLVPLAGFDRTGHRLGYGAGHYDRTIRSLRPRKALIIGLAFAAQETDNILAAAHDERLDMVLTERGVIEFRGAI
jgi:5-formyltetrahydrofolate cyclo-ligase